MGVRGFTTYMAKHSHIFHESYELKNCYLIIDGSGVAINLYVWHTRTNDRFGGDYDNYANTVLKFFKLLKKCNVTPIILFDGGYENRKMKTVFKRMKNRICSIQKLNSTSGKNIKVFPLFTREIFQDIATSLGIRCLRNEHESDSEVACLGRYLNCPILGYDSDFYFFDSLYIPFDKFEMNSVSRYLKESKTREHYIPCEVFRMDNFLNYFGGLDKVNMPLLPVLLGNDYVKKGVFSAFYKHIKLKKSRSENEQQRLIKTVISWLRHETLESAISKILGRFKENRRRFISFKLHNAMKGYLQVSSTLAEHLEDIGVTSSEEDFLIDIFSIEPTCEDEDEDEVGSDSDTSDCDKSEVGSQMSDISDLNEPQSDVKDLISDFEKFGTLQDEDLCFVEKFRQCQLPQCFSDIKWSNTYFCMPLVENYCDPNSHRISLDILCCIHKILNPSTQKPLTCILRTEDKRVRRERQNRNHENLPTLSQIQIIDVKDRTLQFFYIIRVDPIYYEFLELFPSNWHLFLLSMFYWKKNSKKIIDTSYIYSLIICAIFLNVVDSKTGYCRSLKAFERKYKKTHTSISGKFVPARTIKESLKNIERDESVVCLKAMLNYFNLHPKKGIDKKLIEASVVGYFSEFQSCTLHIKYLNALLNSPFENILFHKFFSGTFLFNIVVDFRRRSNLESYLEILFKDCKNFMFCLKIILDNMEPYFGEIPGSDAKKRRKRKSKNNTTENEEID